MVGKLTTVLTKKEAEAYRSQGLHKEALGLYKNLISSSPNLGDTFKDAIQGQMESIQAQLHDGPPRENQMLSAAEIRRIKKGWGASATEGDLLVCAHAFCRMGLYQDALSEAAKLLQKGCAMEKVVNLFADCLVHLRTPEQLFKTIGPLGKKILGQVEARCQFYLLLTEETVNQKHPHHAQALYDYLKTHPVISKKAPQRLDGIAKGIELLEAGDASEAKEEDKEVASSTTENTNEAAMSDPEPPSPKATKKTRSGWLPFFKKRILNAEQR